MEGKVFLVGIGPGIPWCLTPEATDVLKMVDVIIGQATSLSIISDIITGKEIISENMTPVQRSGRAVAKAQDGSKVAIVSFGDPGIFAIASTFFNYVRERNIHITVEVIPGLTMSGAAAAVLGAPLGHDFAVVSVSDLATPWPEVRDRIEAAARADFAIVIYNPLGKSGYQRLEEAFDVVKHFRKRDTPIGIVTIEKGNKAITISSLSENFLPRISADSLVIIGNSQTYVYDNYMITPRNYREGIGY